MLEIPSQRSPASGTVTVNPMPSQHRQVVLRRGILFLGAIVSTLIFSVPRLTEAQMIELIRMPLVDLQAKSDSGDASATLQLALRYSMGTGIPPSESMTDALLQKAAAGGNDTATGICARRGLGRRADPQLAFAAFQKTAATGDIAGIRNLGYCYDNGIGCKADKAMALKLYKQAAATADAASLYFLGMAYRDGTGAEKDLAKAARLYEQAAVSSSVPLLELANCHANGAGVERDVKKANELYLKAGDLGYGLGYSNLAYNYQQGNGVEKDVKKANELYLKAGELGSGRGFNNLGVNYENGNGVEKDVHKANELYLKAGELGYGAGYSSLGYNYEHGFGVEKDVKKANELYLKAGELGDGRGYNNLGYNYEFGNGVGKDVKKANELYLKAGELGSAQGYKNLAANYKTGIGLAQDTAKAREYYDKAAGLGATGIKAELAEMYLSESLPTILVVLGALVVLAVLAWILIKCRRKTVRPPPLPFSQVLSRDRPWPGLASFTEVDATYFHGRELETRELYRLIKRGPITLLFGKSGLGKTSLLNAGLFPLLQDSGIAPVYVRLNHDENAPPLADQVQQAINARLPRLEQPTLWEFFHRIEASHERQPLTVIVLDQFEEIFTLGRETVARRHRSAEFFTQLADLIQNNCPDEAQARFDSDREARRQFDYDKQEFRLLISMREEFLAFLEESRQPLRTLLPQRLRLIEMNGRQALDAISQAGGHLFEAGVGEGIVRSVAGADSQGDAAHASLDDLEVAPALLSLVCSELNEQRLRDKQPQISQQLFITSREQILTGFYERCFQGLDKGMRIFVEELLLTTGGYRDSKAMDDAVRLKGVTPEAIEHLVQQRLLSVDRRAGTSRVEITHDILVTPSRRSRDRRHEKEQGWWSKVLVVSEYAERFFVFAFMIPLGILCAMAYCGLLFGLDMELNDIQEFVMPFVHVGWALALVVGLIAIWVFRRFPGSGWNAVLGCILALLILLVNGPLVFLVLAYYPMRRWNWIFRVALWSLSALLSLLLVIVVFLAPYFMDEFDGTARFGVIVTAFASVYLLALPASLSLFNLFRMRAEVFRPRRSQIITKEVSI